MPGRNMVIQKLSQKICRKSGCRFNKDETEMLLKYYKHRLDKYSEKGSGNNEGKMDRSQFRDVLHQHFNITDDIIMDRVFKGFDQDNDSAISMEEWVRGLSVYLRGGLDEKINFCFNVYDLNNDGHISREEMYQFLKTCLVKANIEEEPEETIKELIELTMKKMDADSDGRVSLQDYRTSVSMDTLLMELLGQCLPNDTNKKEFMQYVLDCEYEEQGIVAS